MNIFCKIIGHKPSSTKYNKEENPYKECLRCGLIMSVKPITLGDKDQKTLKELDSIITNEHMITYIPRSKLKTCRKCSGELFIINPEISMNGKKLHECSICKEREYLRTFSQ